MGLKFKVFLSLIFCTFACHLVFCDIDSQIIAHVVHDVVEEFVVKDHFSLLNIFSDENVESFSSEIINDLISTVAYPMRQFKMRRNALKLHRATKWTSILRRSAIFFLSSLYDLEFIEKTLVVTQSQPVKFFILIPKLSYEDLENSKVFEHYENLSFVSGGIFHFSYFITIENDTLTLSTVEWFSPLRCKYPHLNKLNTFHIKSMNWSSELKNYEKFLQYHGCELVMMLPIPSEDGMIYHVSGYATFDGIGSNFKTHGITPAVFEIASKFHDFKTIYQPVAMQHSYWAGYDPKTSVELIKINGSYRIPQIYFEILSLYSTDYEFVVTSSIVADLNVNILVTPADKYTSLEKFFLPFDLKIWAFLGISFALAFFSVVIINRLSKSVRKIAFGKGNMITLWTIIRIFCGISEPRFPNKNFARFFLIFLILFCFVFRICFQSKFFEFMTNEPRRPPPKTIDDLIDKNYKVYSMDVNAKFSGSFAREMRWYCTFLS
jgi:hypothetical protein